MEKSNPPTMKSGVGGITGIHHVSITVPDMAQALAFYSGVLGFEKAIQIDWPIQADTPAEKAKADQLLVSLRRVHQIKDDEETEGSVAILRAGNTNLELFSFRKPQTIPKDPHHTSRQAGIMHIAVDVVDLESLYPKLVAAGVEFTAPPQRNHHVIATYGRDPFGNFIEFQQIIDTAEIPTLEAAAS